MTCEIWWEVVFTFEAKLSQIHSCEQNGCMKTFECSNMNIKKTTELFSNFACPGLTSSVYCFSSCLLNFFSLTHCLNSVPKVWPNLIIKCHGRYYERMSSVAIIVYIQWYKKIQSQLSANVMKLHERYDMHFINHCHKIFFKAPYFKLTGRFPWFCYTGVPLK